MQKSMWRTRAEAASAGPNIHRTSKPEDDTKTGTLVPPNEPLKTNVHEGKELSGVRSRLGQHEVRRIQMNGGPWSAKVNPLAQPRWFA